MPAETEPRSPSRPRASPAVRPRTAIIGGTGLYDLPGTDVLDVLEVATPFGLPSSPITLARLTAATDPARKYIAGVSGPDGAPVVAFLSRHGRGHHLPPQQINYRANIWALKSLGVEAVISSAAVGGLVASHGTDSFAVMDQLLDRTWGRPDTFYDGSQPAGVQHLGAAEPFCPQLRRLLASALEEHGENFLPTATVAVINGPRFSTRAESAALVQSGAQIISMTQYPEPCLAAELNMGYAAMAYITDADTGHDGSVPVTAELVFARLAAAQPRILAVLSSVVRLIESGGPGGPGGTRPGITYRPEAGIPAAAVEAVMATAVTDGATTAGATTAGAVNAARERQ